MNKDFQSIQPTILIVDDNPRNIQVVALVLREYDYKLIIATDGKSAIELIKRTKPDLILLDVMMPEMDGYETCSIIKSDPENENLPVIFLTALSDKSNIVKGFEMGGVDYIIKPFNKEELVTRVRTHLELKFSHDKLDSMAKNLAELNSVKDKMFSVISHDLRSPVGTIKMMIDLICTDPSIAGNKDLASIFEGLSQNTDELYMLLENLLGWAKSQTNNISFEMEEINMARVVNSNHLLYKGALQQKNLRFKQNIDEELSVFADMNMLQSVIRNLISNAIKFTPENGNIEVSAKRVNGSVQIIVKDSGIGISPETISKLLNSREHFTTFGTNNEKGSGLGLDLCQRFIEKNNGNFRIESNIGSGSSFIVELPAFIESKVKELVIQN